MSRSMIGGVSAKKKKRSAKEIFIKKCKGQDDDALTPEERYKRLIEEKTNEIRNQMLKKAKQGVSLPGCDAEGKKLSKSAEAMIEMMAKKAAKQAAKKNAARRLVVAKSIGGGCWIDKQGKIYGPGGKYYGKVDGKTGKVKAKSGRTLCKYKPNSTVVETIIVRHIQAQNQPKVGIGHGTAATGIWGGPGTAGFWG